MACERGVGDRGGSHGEIIFICKRKLHMEGWWRDTVQTSGNICALAQVKLCMCNASAAGNWHDVALCPLVHPGFHQRMWLWKWIRSTENHKKSQEVWRECCWRTPVNDLGFFYEKGFYNAMLPHSLHSLLMWFRYSWAPVELLPAAESLELCLWYGSWEWGRASNEFGDVAIPGHSISF